MCTLATEVSFPYTGTGYTTYASPSNGTCYTGYKKGVSVVVMLFTVQDSGMLSQLLTNMFTSARVVVTPILRQKYKSTQSARMNFCNLSLTLLALGTLVAVWLFKMTSHALRSQAYLFMFLQGTLVTIGYLFPETAIPMESLNFQ